MTQTVIKKNNELIDYYNVLMNEIKKLNSYNITLEQGFKKRKIDAEVVTEIKKRLGVWEEKEI